MLDAQLAVGRSAVVDDDAPSPRHTCCKEHGRTAPKEAVAFPPNRDMRSSRAGR
jgi:hypothetical protein